MSGWETFERWLRRTHPERNPMPFEKQYSAKDLWEAFGAGAHSVQNGVTIRQFFAGQALAGIMANPVRWKDIERRYKAGKLSYDDASYKNSQKAFSLADQMMKVEQESPQNFNEEKP